MSPFHRMEETLLLTDSALFRRVPRTLATSKFQFFVTLFSGCNPIANATENSILDVARVPGTFLISGRDV